MSNDILGLSYVRPVMPQIIVCTHSWNSWHYDPSWYQRLKLASNTPDSHSEMQFKASCNEVTLRLVRV